MAEWIFRKWRTLKCESEDDSWIFISDKSETIGYVGKLCVQGNTFVEHSPPHFHSLKWFVKKSDGKTPRKCIFYKWHITKTFNISFGSILTKKNLRIGNFVWQKFYKKKWFLWFCKIFLMRQKMMETKIIKCAISKIILIKLKKIMIEVFLSKVFVKVGWTNGLVNSEMKIKM